MSAGFSDVYKIVILCVLLYNVFWLWHICDEEPGIKISLQCHCVILPQFLTDNFLYLFLDMLTVRMNNNI